MSGYDAVAKVAEAKRQGVGYDVVILDWKMPEIDGEYTARAIREAVGEEPTLLICSAYDWTEIEDRARVAGIKGFLQKPFFRSSLTLSLKNCLSGQNLMDNADKSQETTAFRGKRFLVVEDNELNQEVAFELLTAAGAAIECASNGEEGVEKVSLSPEGYYDLVLMDVQMPVMDGYLATRKIRELPREDAKTLPILAMTADAFTEDIEAAKEAGMNGHLSKPLDIGTMNRKISAILRLGNNV